MSMRIITRYHLNTASERDSLWLL